MSSENPTVPRSLGSSTDTSPATDEQSVSLLGDTFDISNGTPNGMIHITVPRLGPTCKRLGIDYAKAIVDWSEFRRRGKRHCCPVFSGVVIRHEDHARLLEALEEKSRRRDRKIEKLSVLAALFTLNRRAKRCRDMAKTYYQNGMHGLAGQMKREKDRIYYFKGQVLEHLVRAGRLTGGDFHRFGYGNWAEVLEGEGYRFHRPSPSQAESPNERQLESIESKPKSAKEPTLDVAYEVVQRFLTDKEKVSIYEWSTYSRPKRGYRWQDEDDEDGIEEEEEEDLNEQRRYW